jgi:hypothetical protein
MLDRRGIACPGAAVGGAILNALPSDLCATASQLLIDRLYAHYNADPERATFFTPNNLAVPAAAFRDLGGFDERFTEGTGEDRDFCARWLERGNRMVYAPAAIVLHAHPLTLGAFWRQHVSYGRGSLRFHRTQSARTARAPRLEPPRFYLGLLVPARPGGGPWRAAALTGLLGLAQVANAAGVARQCFERPRPRPVRSTPVPSA